MFFPVVSVCRTLSPFCHFLRPLTHTVLGTVTTRYWFWFWRLRRNKLIFENTAALRITSFGAHSIFSRMRWRGWWAVSRPMPTIWRRRRRKHEQTIIFWVVLGHRNNRDATIKWSIQLSVLVWRKCKQSDYEEICAADARSRHRVRLCLHLFDLLIFWKIYNCLHGLHSALVSHLMHSISAFENVFSIWCVSSHQMWLEME